MPNIRFIAAFDRCVTRARVCIGPDILSRPVEKTEVID